MMSLWVSGLSQGHAMLFLFVFLFVWLVCFFLAWFGFGFGWLVGWLVLDFASEKGRGSSMKLLLFEMFSWFCFSVFLVLALLERPFSFFFARVTKQI